MFKKLFINLKKLDYVELVEVNINDNRFIDKDGYPVDLFATNFRFHASYDKSKDVVIMKDIDWWIGKKYVNDYINPFINSDKNICYVHAPSYQPNHTPLEYPFTVIAYFWGTKPKNVNFKYTFDDIKEYFLKFNVDKRLYYDRDTKDDPVKRAKYGSDEIILTDLIFNTFDIKDILPFGTTWNNYKLLNFFIIHSKNKNNSTYITFITNLFKSLKEQVDINDKSSDNINISKYNYDDIDKFLYGDPSNNNNFCCLLPLYNKIDVNTAKIYYEGLLKTNSDILNLNINNNIISKIPNNGLANVRNYYITSIKEYMINQGVNAALADEIIFSCSFNRNIGSRFVANNDKYLYDIYYTFYQHLGDKNVVITNFVDKVINNYINTSEFKIIKDYSEVINKQNDIFYKENKLYSNCNSIQLLQGGSVDYTDSKDIDINCTTGLKYECKNTITKYSFNIKPLHLPSNNNIFNTKSCTTNYYGDFSEKQQVPPMSSTQQEISPPASLPKTQSTFYMPLITYAYNQVKKIPISDKLKNESGTVRGLFQVTDQVVNSLVSALNTYLTTPVNLQTLEAEYVIDNIPGDGQGHIDSVKQEEILNAAKITTNIRAGGQDFVAGDPVKDVLDSLITNHYGIQMAGMKGGGISKNYRKMYLKYKKMYMAKKRSLA